MGEQNTDQILVERVQHGDKKAFDLLVLKYQQRIMKVLSRLIAITLLAASALVFAEDTGELSKKLNNPVAALITVPMEYNKDTDIGPNKTGEVESIKFTPVIPIDFNKDWNLISRTIFSYVDQDIPEFGLDETGISDIAQTFYFSPKLIGDNGVIWGAGAIMLFIVPSGNREDLLLLRWQYAEQLPFGVLLLFGGGMSLARRVADTGLAEWLDE